MKAQGKDEMPKAPKDLHKYIPSYVAAARLINLAVEHILARPKTLVKWELKLSLYHSPDEIKNSKSECIPVRGTIGSGDWEEPKKLAE